LKNSSKLFNPPQNQFAKLQRSTIASFHADKHSMAEESNEETSEMKSQVNKKSKRK
jgi:hypothetical protein